jgi:hypothetical protein
MRKYLRVCLDTLQHLKSLHLKYLGFLKSGSQSKMNPGPTLDEFELKIENHLDGPYQGVVGFGTCLPPGAAPEGAQFHFQDRAGNLFPARWRPLLREKNGASWVYFSLPISLRRLEFSHFTLRSGSGPQHQTLEVEEREGAILIRNRDDELLFEASSLLGLSSLSRGGVPLLGGQSQARIEGEGETFQLAAPLQMAIKSANDFEVTIEARGELASQSSGDGLFLRLQYTVQLGRPGFALNALFSNRRSSDQELRLQRFALSWSLAAPVEATIVRQLATGNLCLSQDLRIEGPLCIRDGRLEETSALDLPALDELYPFFQRMDREAFFGRVGPYFGLVLVGGALVVSWGRSSHLDANSARVEDGSLILEPILAGSGGAGARRVPQGFSRSFDFTFSSHLGPLDGEEAASIREAADYYPLTSVHPRWYVANRVQEMDRIIPYRPDLHPRFEQGLWREFAKGYFNGFYDAGDWVSGRGTAQMHAEAGGFTWNNNEEDNLKGIAWMLMRTGDPSYADDLRVCARHLLEVDRVARSSHPLQDGVLLAHSLNHFDGTGYPSHCWAEGLLLYYKLSGDEDALEAFFALCECLLRWAQTPDKMRFADAREMGVPLTNFAHAYALRGDPKYLHAARIYIARLRRQMDQDGGLYYKFSSFAGRMALYSEYVAVEGLWDFYELVGGDDADGVRDLLLEIIQWIDRYALDAFGNYDARGTSESMLHLFAIGFWLTGDEAWLERGRRGLGTALSQPSGLPLLKFNNNAAFYNLAWQRGWFNDSLVPLAPSVSHRAVNRTYATPTWEWEKRAIIPKELKEKGNL